MNQPTTFGAFADAHYAPGLQYSDRHCGDSLAKIDDAVEWFNQSGAAFVVNLGDSTDKADTHEQFVANATAVGGAIARADADVHTLIGNRDLDGLTKAQVLDAIGGASRSPYYSFDVGGAHFVVLDTNCLADGTDPEPGSFNWSMANVSEAQLDWLTRDLTSAAGRPTVIFAHALLDHWVRDGRLCDVTVNNAAQVREVINASGNVVAVFHGHWHYGGMQTLGATHYVTLQAMCIGGGAANNAAALATLHPDGSVEVEGRGRQPSMSLSAISPAADAHTRLHARLKPWCADDNQPPAAARAMSPVLGEERVAQFYREGYIVVPGLVAPEVCDEVVAADGRDYSGSDFWSPRIFKHDDPTVDREIHRLLVEPTVVGAVEELFEAPARVYYGMLAVVPAGGGKGLPWHQDNMYSCILGRALNAFMALCDITPDKAILWVAPGSHRKGVRDSHAADTHHGHREADVEPEGGMPLPAMRKGDVCIFDRMTLHRSLTNSTAEHRFAYAAQLMEDKARAAETGARDASRMLAVDLRRTLVEGEVASPIVAG